MENSLTKRQASLISAALVRHDGVSIMPEWERKKQRELTHALDTLRGALLKIKRGE